MSREGSAVGRRAWWGAVASVAMVAAAFLSSRVPAIGEGAELFILLAPLPLVPICLGLERRFGASSRSRVGLAWLWRLAALASALLVSSVLLLAFGFEAPQWWWLSLVAACGLFGPWMIGASWLGVRCAVMPAELGLVGAVAGGSWSLILVSALVDAVGGLVGQELRPLWAANLVLWIFIYPVWGVALARWSFEQGQGTPRARAEAPA